MGQSIEKSGVDVTAADSGWPVGAAGEPGFVKDGTGTDGLPDVTKVEGGIIFDSGTDEVQKVTVTAATGGTYTLTFEAKTTAAIAYNATAATVKAKLAALSTIGKGNVSVAGNAGGPYTVTFEGALADKNVPTLTADDAELTGEGAAVTITTEAAGKPL